MRQLTSLDAQFLALGVLLPPQRWRLREVPLGLDYPYWIDDVDFDLHFHVRELGLPAPGGRRATRRAGRANHSRPLDRARPLWALYLISGLASGHAAMLTKIQHAVIDGLPGAEILGLLLDLTPEIRQIETTGPWGDNTPVPSDLGMLGGALLVPAAAHAPAPAAAKPRASAPSTARATPAACTPINVSS